MIKKEIGIELGMVPEPHGSPPPISAEKETLKLGKQK
jgi:hypothetical protein